MVGSIINTAVSGLQAATNRINVSANNVANQRSTSGEVYGAQQVQQSSAAQGGVRSEAVLKQPATVPSPEGEVPNVSLEEEVVQQQIASYDFKANLNVIKAADEMLEETIDILA